MNGEKFNQGANFNQDDDQNWDNLTGVDRTDEEERIINEEDQEIKDLYPGEYDEESSVDVDYMDKIKKRNDEEAENSIDQEKEA